MENFNKSLMSSVTPQMLKAAVFKAAPDIHKFLPHLRKYMPMAGIDTPNRVCHFLAQVGKESNGFRSLRENMNYSAKGLLDTFPKRFGVKEAVAYARKPQQIANRAYAGRLGNGPEASGDGWRFRGGGLVHVTGRAQYQKLSRAMFGDDRLLANPDLLVEPEWAVYSACLWWKWADVNEVADTGVDKDANLAVTKKVNGGTNGLDDRYLRLEVATKIISNIFT